MTKPLPTREQKIARSMRGKRNAAKPDAERKRHRVELSLTDAERAHLDTIAPTPQAAIRKLIDHDITVRSLNDAKRKNWC